MTSKQAARQFPGPSFGAGPSWPRRENAEGVSCGQEASWSWSPERRRSWARLTQRVSRARAGDFSFTTSKSAAGIRSVASQAAVALRLTARPAFAFFDHVAGDPYTATPPTCPRPTCPMCMSGPRNASRWRHGLRDPAPRYHHLPSDAAGAACRPAFDLKGSRNKVHSRSPEQRHSSRGEDHGQTCVPKWCSYQRRLQPP